VNQPSASASWRRISASDIKHGAAWRQAASAWRRAAKANRRIGGICGGSAPAYGGMKIDIKAKFFHSSRRTGAAALCHMQTLLHAAQQYRQQRQLACNQKRAQAAAASE